MQSFKDFVPKGRNRRFWSNFVLKDCFSYICLFLAIQTSSWDLRMLALKSMSCLFSAYDRPSYSKILPNHLADIQSYPTDLLGCLRAGGFTVKFTGHAVALDEAHEMGINRDMKMKRPTQTYIKKMTHFFSYRITLCWSHRVILWSLMRERSRFTFSFHLLVAALLSKVAGSCGVGLGGVGNSCD